MSESGEPLRSAAQQPGSRAAAAADFPSDAAPSASITAFRCARLASRSAAATATNCYGFPFTYFGIIIRQWHTVRLAFRALVSARDGKGERHEEALRQNNIYHVSPSKIIIIICVNIHTINEVQLNAVSSTRGVMAVSLAAIICLQT